MPAPTRAECKDTPPAASHAGTRPIDSGGSNGKLRPPPEPSSRAPRPTPPHRPNRRPPTSPAPPPATGCSCPSSRPTFPAPHRATGCSRSHRPKCPAPLQRRRFRRRPSRKSARVRRHYRRASLKRLQKPIFSTFNNSRCLDPGSLLRWSHQPLLALRRPDKGRTSEASPVNGLATRRVSKRRRAQSRVGPTLSAATFTKPKDILPIIGAFESRSG